MMQLGYSQKVETRTSLCPACGRQLKPSDEVRCVELSLSDDAIPFSELATQDSVDIDIQEARAWVCTECVEPIARVIEAVRATLYNLTRRSS